MRKCGSFIAFWLAFIFLCGVAGFETVQAETYSNMKKAVSYTVEKVYYEGDELVLEGFFLATGELKPYNVWVPTLVVLWAEKKPRELTDYRFLTIKGGPEIDPGLLDLKLGEKYPYTFRLKDVPRKPLKYFQALTTIYCN